jgi:ureidoglycolate hydrolase
LIEKYYKEENGYHPFFIRAQWQVAQLNYLPSLCFSCIEQLERHTLTDEIFVLTKGQAVLVGATIEQDQVSFECVLMEQGVTYNIPVNRWHAIAMSEDAQVIIVEKNDTHLGDVFYYPLSNQDKQLLKNTIMELVKK